MARVDLAKVRRPMERDIKDRLRRPNGTSTLQGATGGVHEKAPER
jgi:hypothetical protein